jgi:hypothetical protein
MRKGPTEPSSPAANAPVWLKALVVLHIVAITIWCLPIPPQSIMNGSRDPVGTEWLLVANQDHLKTLPPVKAYLFATGAWQYWDMFSPNPTQTDYYASAEVEYKDGTRKPFYYPRVADYPIAAKYTKERYRKFFERVRLADNKWLWPYFAQRIALLSVQNPENPPVRVRLTSHWKSISPPGVEQPKEYSSSMFYDHPVDQAKLREDLGVR